MSTVYDFEAQTIAGQTVRLDQFKGAVLLVVNTASQCGFTPQFEGLESLWKDFEGKGADRAGLFLAISLALQDPGQQHRDRVVLSDQRCELSHDGQDRCEWARAPLYQWLVKEAPGIWAPSRSSGISPSF